jgi:6-phosphogluconolactonase
MRVIVHPDGRSLATHAAGLIASIVAASERTRVSVGLAGGSTPRATYEFLRAEQIDWDAVDLWLSDERWVDHEDADSNGRMATEALTSHVPAVLNRPRFNEFLTAADSAAFYEAELRRLIPDGRADLILLGMGDDGHTASLFPGTAALEVDNRWYVENWVPKLDTWRLSATKRMITEARTVMVLAAGAAKADMLAVALEGEDGAIPIQLVRHAGGEVIWMVDDAAASNLSSTVTERGA